MATKRTPLKSILSTTLHFKGDGAPDINFFVTSLGGDPVRGVLAPDEALHDGALGLEVLSNDIDIASPGTLGAAGFWKENDPFSGSNYRGTMKQVYFCLQ